MLEAGLVLSTSMCISFHPPKTRGKWMRTTTMRMGTHPYPLSPDEVIPHASQPPKLASRLSKLMTNRKPPRITSALFHM
jgi:hypothetical protein